MVFEKVDSRVVKSVELQVELMAATTVGMMVLLQASMSAVEKVP